MSAAKKKRPPRQVWIRIGNLTGLPYGVYLTRKSAMKGLEPQFDHVVGPYVLAERVRES